MLLKIEEAIKSIWQTCKSLLKEEELWPSYYNRRYIEFLSYLKVMPQEKFDRVLELGCGIGYQSAFLSQISDELIATDLEHIDKMTHSPGLQKTRDFLNKLGIKNAKVQHASAMELPFPDNSFDMVFSSHVLEHVPDRSKAIEEINRVLKPGGYNFVVVPTRIDKVYALPNYYIYLLKRSLYHGFKIIKSRISPTSKVAVKSGSTEDSGKVSGDSVKFWMKYFPFPPPHGEYPHFINEFKEWNFEGWKRVMTANNKYKLIGQSSSQLNPLFPLLAVVSPTTGVFFHKITRPIEEKLGKIPFVKTFSINTILITQKSSAGNI